MPINPAGYFGLIAFTVHIFFYLVYAISVVKKNNTLADLGWAISFPLMAWFAVLLTGNWDMRSTLMIFLVFIWSMRLSLHLYFRSKNKGEDFRYLHWRKNWGGKWWVIKSYFQIYLVKTWLALIVALPIMWIPYFGVGRAALSPYDFFGYLIWGLGFFIEAIADHQLREFKTTHRNPEAVMKSGLWKYCRHPNYLGEILVWWGLFLMAVQLPFGWLLVISPVLMTILLLAVTGVPLIEQRYKHNKDYQKYSQETGAIIPFLNQWG